MHRKFIFLLLFLLVSCTVSPAETATPTEPPFVYNQECPHVCWLHINPGVTTMQEALALVSASKEVSVENKPEDTRITVSWHKREWKGKKSPFYIDLLGENGIVNAMVLQPFDYLTLESFIDLLGEPDEIALTKEEKNGVTSIEYTLYYKQEKIFIGSWSEDLTGPQLTDPLGVVYTNIDLGSDYLPYWLTADQFQPWLGFGKADEYLLHK